MYYRCVGWLLTHRTREHTCCSLWVWVRIRLGLTKKLSNLPDKVKKNWQKLELMVIVLDLPLSVQLFVSHYTHTKCSHVFIAALAHSNKSPSHVPVLTFITLPAYTRGQASIVFILTSSGMAQYTHMRKVALYPGVQKMQAILHEWRCFTRKMCNIQYPVYVRSCLTVLSLLCFSELTRWFFCFSESMSISLPKSRKIHAVSSEIIKLLNQINQCFAPLQ